MLGRLDLKLITGWIFGLGAIALLYWIDPGTESKPSRGSQQALEARRVATGDPLQDLGGCMANHATPVSKQAIANVMYYWDAGATVPADTAAPYYRVRQLLLDACPDYWSKAKSKQASITETQLNTVLYVALKDDQEVQKALATLHQAESTIRSIYVK